MTQVLPYKSAVPAVPREVTRRAARRAWAELPVQLWWKSALLVLIITGVVAADVAADALHHRRLIRTGTPVQAKLIEVAQTSRAGFAVIRTDTVPVKLQWTNPTDGKTQTVTAVLPPGPGYAKVNELLDIRVSPDDPADWIEATGENPWARMWITFMLVPVAVLLFALSWWQRRRVLEVWRNGKRADGIVVSCTHAAMSPASRICRFTYADGRDRRVFKLLYPSRRGVPKKGDTLPLVALQDAPHRAVAAELYVGAS
jgi:hypothetical protein